MIASNFVAVAPCDTLQLATHLYVWRRGNVLLALKMAEKGMTLGSDEVAEILTSGKKRNIWIPLQVAEIVAECNTQ